MRSFSGATPHSETPGYPRDGWLAQLVERLPYKQNVSGSTPLPPTTSFLER